MGEVRAGEPAYKTVRLRVVDALEEVRISSRLPMRMSQGSLVWRTVLNVGDLAPGEEVRVDLRLDGVATSGDVRLDLSAVRGGRRVNVPAAVRSRFAGLE